MNVTSGRGQVLSCRSEWPLSVKYRHHQEGHGSRLAWARMRGPEHQGTTQPQAKRLYRDPAWHVVRRMVSRRGSLRSWAFTHCAIAAESCPTYWTQIFSLTWHRSGITQLSCGRYEPCAYLTENLGACVRARYVRTRLSLTGRVTT